MSGIRRCPVGATIRPEDRLPVVTGWTGPDDWDNAPPDYDAFVRQYLSYTRATCLRFGVPTFNLDDVVASIITRFMERDLLADFDPEFVTKGVAHGTSERARFRSYYSWLIYLYAKGKKRNSVRLVTHEFLILDEPCDEEADQTFGDLLTAGFHEEFAEEVECRDLEERLRATAAESGDGELASVVDAIVLLSRTLSRPPRPADLTQVLGCSASVARRALLEVRRLARELLTERDTAGVSS